MTTLDWKKYPNGEWCRLIDLNLAQPHFNGMEGVYVIWHKNPQPRCVRVGQGNISDRLGKHREDSEILAYRANELLVTWAPVETRFRDGVERFLGDALNPLVGSRFPDAQPILVNIP